MPLAIMIGPRHLFSNHHHLIVNSNSIVNTLSNTISNINSNRGLSRHLRRERLLLFQGLRLKTVGHIRLNNNNNNKSIKSCTRPPLAVSVLPCQPKQRPNNGTVLSRNKSWSNGPSNHRPSNNCDPSRICSDTFTSSFLHAFKAFPIMLILANGPPHPSL